MRAGQLDREIKIERGTHTLDQYGTPQFVWTEFVTLRARIIQATTEEFQRAFGASGETAIIFRTWFYDGITLADRVIYDGLIHNILEIKEIGRRNGLEIRTRSTGEVAPAPPPPEPEPEPEP